MLAFVNTRVPVALEASPAEPAAVPVTTRPSVIPALTGTVTAEPEVWSVVASVTVRPDTEAGVTVYV